MTTLIIYTLIIIAFAVLIIWRPSIALTALICMYGLKQWAQASHPFFLQYHAFTNLVVGALIVLAVWVHHMRGKSLIAGYPKVAWLVIGLFMYALASTFWASLPDLSLEQWNKAWPYIITQIILMPLLIYRADEFRSAFVLLFVMGTLISILLLFTVEWEYRSIVLSNTGIPIYGNPLAPAQMAGNVAFATLFLKFRHKLKIWAILKWMIIALNLALIVKSGSRGQLIAAILLMSLALPFSQQIRSMKGWIVIAIAISSILSITYWTLELFWGGDQKISDPMAKRWSEETISEDMGGRFKNVLLLMRLWFSTPMTLLFGLGNSTSYDPHVIGIYPHFVPAEILCEEGLIGFGLFVLILLLTIRSVVRTYKKVKHNEEDRSVLIVLCLMFLYEFLLSMKQGSMLGNLLLFTFAIALGRFESGVAVKSQVVEKQIENPGQLSIDNVYRSANLQGRSL